MTQDQIVNRVLRDMKQVGLISTDIEGELRVGETRYYLNVLYQAATETKTKESARRNMRKIEQFTLDGKRIGEFNSIREAAAAAGYGKRFRGGDYIIANVLAGRHPHSKEGYVWKYKTSLEKINVEC